MAFVVLSGCPSAGKTRLAHLLQHEFQRRIGQDDYQGHANEVMIIEDDIGQLGRTVYSGEPISSGGEGERGGDGGC